MSRTIPSQVQLRAASLADIEAIVAIERESFSDPWSARSFRELVGRPNVVCEVAVRGGGEERGDAASGDPATLAPLDAGAVSGGGILGFSVIYLAGSEGDLANLATASSARRGGVGRRLLRHMLDVAAARGARTIFLEVRESNGAARALYTSEGFVDVGRRAKYYARPVEDALILRKELS